MVKGVLHDGGGGLAHPGDVGPAEIHGDQDPVGAAGGDSVGDGGGDLPQHGVRQGDAQGDR